MKAMNNLYRNYELPTSWLTSQLVKYLINIKIQLKNACVCFIEPGTYNEGICYKLDADYLSILRQKFIGKEGEDRGFLTRIENSDIFYQVNVNNLKLINFGNEFVIGVAIEFIKFLEGVQARFKQTILHYATTDLSLRYLPGKDNYLTDFYLAYINAQDADAEEMDHSLPVDPFDVDDPHNKLFEE